jgi:dolichol-phosphate mannosyltransferase
VIYVLIPAYNEETQLPQMLANLVKTLGELENQYHIIVVDDGSSDNTDKALSEFNSRIPIQILTHPTNLGVSSAFKTGFDFILNHGQKKDLILTMEANKSSDAKIIPKMLEAIKSGQDLVLASCYAKGGKVVGDPWSRLILSRGANLLLQLLFPCQGIHTYTSFYRLFTFDILQELSRITQGRYFDQGGFVCMADMLIKLCKLRKFKISETPLVLVSDLQDSGSKMKIGKTILGYLKLNKDNGLF